MRKLAFISLALLCLGAAPPNRAAPIAPRDTPPEPSPPFDRMNLMRDRQGCVSIPRQVAGEDRRYDGTRLDRQPPGRLMLAVQREVNGCPEAVFVGSWRR